MQGHPKYIVYVPAPKPRNALLALLTAITQTLRAYVKLVRRAHRLERVILARSTPPIEFPQR